MPKTPPTSKPLSPAELERYDRQIRLSNFSLVGQQRLKQARLLVVGAGGLGCAALPYLAAAGIGHISLIDPDQVELSNLGRQVLYRSQDINRPKVDCAAEHLHTLNPHNHYNPIVGHLNTRNADTLIADHDVIVDGTDAYATRLLINQTCIRQKKPLVSASVYGFKGLCTVFAPHLGGPCYACLFQSLLSETPPVTNCNNGVLGVVPGLLGNFQALEAIKLCAGLDGTLIGRVMILDALTHQQRYFNLSPDPNCAQCSGSHSPLSKPIETPSNPMPAVPIALSPQAARVLRATQKQAIWLDVRTYDEVKQFRIDKRHIPLDELLGRLDELDRTVPIIVYCRVGQRSYVAGQLLLAAGFSKVYNLQGGVLAWQAEEPNT